MDKRNEMYSHLNDIPVGQASDIFTPGCLVLEGGAFRGLYTSGVLDVLMQNDITLTHTIGVSAGALNGLNYVSGNIGRSALINLTYRNDPRYVGRKAILNNHGVIGHDFLFSQEVNQKYPLNLKRFCDPRLDFVAVATDCISGEPTYFHKDSENIFMAIKASSSMPFVSEMVMIGGRPYLDGGASIKIPLDYAMSFNQDKMVVVTTRPKEYRRTKPEFKELNKLVYHRYSQFEAAQAKSGKVYNYTMDRLAQMEKEGRLFWIAPSQPIHIHRLEKDVEKLGDLYWLGYHDAENVLTELKEYLKK